MNKQLWLSLALVLVGTVLAYFSFFRFQEARASARWPSVQGVVISSEAATVSDGGSNRFAPDVLYEYTVNGVLHRARAVTLERRTFDSEAEAAEIAARYSDGAQVQVHYNAVDPSQAVLEPGGPVPNVVMLGGGVVAVVFGMSGVVISLTSRR
jgi:hypothetical protein